MPETLLIRLDSAAQIRDWMTLDEQGQPASGVQSGELDANIAANRRLVVLVPGEDVRFCDARVPGKNRQRILQAIPYALEEQMAEDVEHLHFAIGPALEEGEYPVAVVARRQMDAWLATLSELGLSVDEMISEIQVLPLEPGSWSLLVEGDRALVRSSNYTGFATDTQNVATLFELYAGREAAPERVQVFGDTVVDLGLVEVDMDTSERPVLVLLAKGLGRRSGIDLLQGSYSQKEDFGQLFTPWRATATLLLAGLLLALVSVGVDNYRLEKQSRVLSAQIEQLYRRTFPNAKRVVNARAQMEQQLKQLQRQSGTGSTDFMALLGETGKVLKKTPGVQISGASFRDGRLDLELAADNLQLLDKLKQALNSTGRLQAEIQSATTEAGQKVKSRLRVQGVAS